MENTLVIGDSFSGFTKLLSNYSKTFHKLEFPSTTMIGLKNKNILKRVKPIIKKHKINKIILMFGYVDIAGDVFMKETQTKNNINKIMKIIINNFNIVVNELKNFNLDMYIINPILTPFYKNKKYYIDNCIHFTYYKNLDNLNKRCDKLFKTYLDRMKISKKYIYEYCKKNKIKFIDMNPILKFIINSKKIVYMGQIRKDKKHHLDHHYISPIFLVTYLITIYNKKIQKDKVIKTIEKLIKDYHKLCKKLQIDNFDNFFYKYSVKLINDKLKLIKN